MSRELHDSIDLQDSPVSFRNISLMVEMCVCVLNSRTKQPKNKKEIMEEWKEEEDKKKLRFESRREMTVSGNQGISGIIFSTPNLFILTPPLLLLPPCFQYQTHDLYVMA
jgi:hypothetical protein